MATSGRHWCVTVLKSSHWTELVNICMYVHAHTIHYIICCCSVTQSCPTLWPRGLQHARPPCPSPSPRVHPRSCSLHWWCRPAISSPDPLFSFCSQSFPASGTFPMSHLFTSEDQNTGASASYTHAYLSNIYTLKTMSSNPYLNSKLTPQAYSGVLFFLISYNEKPVSIFTILIYSLSPPEGNPVPHQTIPITNLPANVLFPTPFPAAVPAQVPHTHSLGSNTYAWMLLSLPLSPTRMLSSPWSQPSWPMVGFIANTHTEAISSSLLGSDASCQTIHTPFGPSEAPPLPQK